MSKRKKKTNKPEIINPLESMLDRFHPLLPADEWAKVLDSLDTPLYQAVRLNPLKSKSSITRIAAEYGWEVTPVPYCDNGFWVKQSPLPISKTTEHQIGHYYIQDAASMLPVELFDFSGLENPTILDMAASPGGKTTHLLSKTMDTGLVLANDSSRDRLTALRIVLQNWGASHYAVSNYPGEKFGTWFPETFDRILLDAPCSMQGLRATEAHPLRGITQKEINALARRQTKLLSSAIHALKPDGQVVYSTCTLTPEENEGVLQAVLDHFGSAIQIDAFEDIVPTSAKGLSTANRQEFDPQVHNAARLWPHVFGTAGFFAARITKLGPTPGLVKEAPSRPLAQAGWHPLDSRDEAVLIESLSDIYGFSFSELCERENWELWTFKQTLHCFPRQFFTHFSDFPVQALGLNLGEKTPDGLQLSHEFATRFGSLFTQNRIKLNPEESQTYMAGSDILISGNRSDNLQVILDDQNRVLGRGKWIEGRLKNLLPHRLRII